MFPLEETQVLSIVSVNFRKQDSINGKENHSSSIISSNYRESLVVGRRARTKHYQKQGPNASYVTERNETTRLACVSWAMRDERCNESLKCLVNYLSVSSTSKKPIESRSCVRRAFHVPRFVRIYRTRVNVEFFLDFLLARNQVGVRFLLCWKYISHSSIFVNASFVPKLVQNSRNMYFYFYTSLYAFCIFSTVTN